MKRKPYPMTRIHESMQMRSGYTHFTKMDLSIELDEESKKYTTIITPDGQLSKYNRLPMGIKISLDETQAIMEEIIQGLGVTCYIYNLGFGRMGYSVNTCISWTGSYKR